MYKEIIVNKKHTLIEDFIPKDMIKIYEPTGDKLGSSYVNMLDKEAYQNFKLMQSAAKEEGYFIWINSSFRTFRHQERLYKRCIDEMGQDEANLICEEPGASEHQTGLAIDIIFSRNGEMVLQQNEKDPEIAWLMKNSYLYGYILRYPLGKEKLTGYNFEPNHYRYVGKSLATKLCLENITLEEYYEPLIREEMNLKLLKKS